MKKTLLIILTILLVLTSCAKSKSPVNAPEPKELIQKFAYSVGGMVYQYYGSYYQIDEKNIQYFLKGIYDMSKGAFLYDEATQQQIFSDYTESVLQEMRTENLKKAEDFLAQNAKNEGVVTTESGLQYKVLKEGNDKHPQSDSIVKTYYKLSDLEGNDIQVVDSSNGPVSFAVNQLVPGISEGLCLMTEGSSYRFWVHPKLGYGENGSSSIAPNQLLIFDFEIVSIE